MRTLLAMAAAAAVGILGAAACSDVPKSTDKITINGPSLADFAGANGVSAVLERNCGSLDCHGNDAFALRLYGQNGLRKPFGLNTVVVPDAGGPVGDAGVPLTDDEDVSDAGPPKTGGEITTTDEVLANYQSVVSLEPRLMQAVVKGGDPYQLLLLKKPLLVESHKGGPALHKNGDAETCIVSWLKNKTDKVACGNGLKPP